MLIVARTVCLLCLWAVLKTDKAARNVKIAKKSSIYCELFVLLQKQTYGNETTKIQNAEGFLEETS